MTVLLEKLQRELERVEVYRKKAIEFKDRRFPDLEGFSLIEGMPNHVVDGVRHYYYIVEEVSERLFLHHARTLDECALAVMAVTGMSRVDVIGALEAMAIPICTSFCLKTRKPMAVIGKRKYVDDVSGYTPPGQIEIVKTTGCSETRLYANDIPRGGGVLLVELMSSTGGSLRRVAEELTRNGVKAADMVTIIGKPDYGYEEEMTKSGQAAKTLLKVHIKNYVELGDGHGRCETSVEKTRWFRKAEPRVDGLRDRYMEAMTRLLET